MLDEYKYNVCTWCMTTHACLYSRWCHFHIIRGGKLDFHDFCYVKKLGHFYSYFHQIRKQNNQNIFASWKRWWILLSYHYWVIPQTEICLFAINFLGAKFTLLNTKCRVVVILYGIYTFTYLYRAAITLKNLKKP